MDAGQPAEQQRVGGDQCLHVRYHGIDVIGDMRPVVVIDAAHDHVGSVVEDRADLGEIGVRRVGGRGSIRQQPGSRRESVGVVRCGRRAQRRDRS